MKINEVKVYNFDGAIRGMRNPLGSWEKSDSMYCYERKNCEHCPLYVESMEHACKYSEEFDYDCYIIGPDDLTLMQKLIKAGTDHSKFMRQILVCMDINAPLYWWKEFDTYKVGTVANSTSTMHTLHHGTNIEDFSDDFNSKRAAVTFGQLVELINDLMIDFTENNNKGAWEDAIKLLPSNFNQTRTVTLNYQVLSNIYRARNNHKLSEWKVFCSEIEKMPYAMELIAHGTK